MVGLLLANPRDRQRLSDVADGLAIAVAVSLPWSTSATGILLGLWLFALIPTLNWPDVREQLVTWPGGLPVLLVALGVAGMLWADVPWIERWGGLGSFLKLLAIPLLFVQFRRSDRGRLVMCGYLTSCVALLILSAVVINWPGLIDAAEGTLRYGVPVKNAATQSGEFVTCIFGTLYLAIDYYERQRWVWLAALLAVIFGMLANIFYVATGRTALVIIPVLLVIFAAKRLSKRGIIVLFVATVMIGSVGWFSSPYLRDRALQVWTDLQSYALNEEKNSSGERIEFWKKSIEFIRAAPIFGNGTGSITPLFVKASAGKTGAAGSATTNPHNQTFAVTIQLGLLGASLLWAMWISYILLFRGSGLAEWVGIVVVVQNIAGSLFNSHLFDFVQGWVYVVGVGVAGGIALKNRTIPKSVGATT